MDKVKICYYLPRELEDKIRKEAYETRKTKTEIIVRRLEKSYEEEKK
jgi:hypothetical protein